MISWACSAPVGRLLQCSNRNSKANLALVGNSRPHCSRPFGRRGESQICHQPYETLTPICPCQNKLANSIWWKSHRRQPAKFWTLQEVHDIVCSGQTNSTSNSFSFFSIHWQSLLGNRNNFSNKGFAFIVYRDLQQHRLAMETFWVKMIKDPGALDNFWTMLKLLNYFYRVFWLSAANTPYCVTQEATGGTWRTIGNKHCLRFERSNSDIDIDWEQFCRQIWKKKMKKLIFVDPDKQLIS